MTFKVVAQVTKEYKGLSRITLLQDYTKHPAPIRVALVQNEDVIDFWIVDGKEPEAKTELLRYYQENCPWAVVDGALVQLSFVVW